LLHKDFSIPARRKANVIARLLREGVTAGELAENTDIDSMAWYYLGVLQAVLNLPQVGADLSILDRMIEVAMSAWPSTLKPLLKLKVMRLKVVKCPVAPQWTSTGCLPIQPSPSKRPFHNRSFCDLPPRQLRQRWLAECITYSEISTAR
jgi:hypothetical protein